MNATLGHWLFSSLGAQRSRALRKPRAGESGFQPVNGTFDPDAGAVIPASAQDFEARYHLGTPLADLAGSEIGEGRVPDRTELQACVRRPENPCALNNHTAYVVTELDVQDLRYVATINRRPAWETIEAQGLLCTREQGGGGGGGGGTGECERQLETARAEIATLRTEIAALKTEITALKAEIGQKDVSIGQLETEVTRLRALVPVVVPADIDKTVALLKGAGPTLTIGPGVKARFTRLGRFVDSLKARKP